MKAKNLITDTIAILHPTDTIGVALEQMNEYHVTHLPIVKDGEFFGLVSEDDLLDFVDMELPLDNVRLRSPKVFENEHFYEAVKLITTWNLSLIPVIDKTRQYIGVITVDDLLKQLAQAGAFTEPGSILVLEMNRSDYSLEKIARIIEQEGAFILSSFVISIPETNKVEVTVKLNVQEIKHIVATLHRFDYILKNTFQESDYLEELKDKYEAFMHYLNI